MKSVKRPILILLAIGVSLGVCACAIEIRPDTYVSGDYSPYYHYYGVYYPYRIISVVNGTTDNLQVLRDGEKLPGTLAPGQHFKLKIRVGYRESRTVSLVALAYREGKLFGAAKRSFHFYGGSREQRSETWLIRDSDIRR
jgi:hypothetical protein